MAVQGNSGLTSVRGSSTGKGSGSRLKLASLTRLVGLSGGRRMLLSPVGGSHLKVDDNHDTQMNAACAIRSLLSRRKVILNRNFPRPSYVCLPID